MTGKKHILIVDDEADFRETLAEQFELSEGFEVTSAGTGEEALGLAAAQRVDIIVLDVDMPGITGIETCKRLRAAGVRAPVIMLTGRTGEADTVAGLDAGANDYVAKPFTFSVLLARVRAQLRTAAPRPASCRARQARP